MTPSLKLPRTGQTIKQRKTVRSEIERLGCMPIYLECRQPTRPRAGWCIASPKRQAGITAPGFQHPLVEKAQS